VETIRGGSLSKQERISKVHSGAYSLPDSSLLFLGYSMALILTILAYETEDF
jgi:hypothetical protein